jgi:hypothetical protein
MSDDEFDELPADVQAFTGQSYNRINDFFDDDLETVDLQSTIAPSNFSHAYQRSNHNRGNFQNSNYRGNNQRNDRNRTRRNYQHTTQKVGYIPETLTEEELRRSISETLVFFYKSLPKL